MFLTMMNLPNCLKLFDEKCWYFNILRDNLASFKIKIKKSIKNLFIPLNIILQSFITLQRLCAKLTCFPPMQTTTVDKHLCWKIRWLWQSIKALYKLTLIKELLLTCKIFLEWLRLRRGSELEPFDFVTAFIDGDLTNLLHLDLSECSKIDDAGIIAVANNCPNLGKSEFFICLVLHGL